MAVPGLWVCRRGARVPSQRWAPPAEAAAASALLTPSWGRVCEGLALVRNIGVPTSLGWAGPCAQAHERPDSSPLPAARVLAVSGREGLPRGSALWQGGHEHSRQRVPGGKVGTLLKVKSGSVVHAGGLMASLPAHL